MDTGQSLITLFTSSIHAGFPSPADDYEDKKLDLNDYLISNRAATFFLKVAGDSMTGSGIFPEDLLIVDRSIEAKSGDVVIGYLNGEFTVKRIVLKGNNLYLEPDNPAYQILEVGEGDEFDVWGVVTYVIHGLQTHRPRRK